MPAATDGPRCATWSILCSCRHIPLDQVDLDLVGGGETADQVRTADARVCCATATRAGCCRRDGSTRRPGRCRGSRVPAPRPRWPRPPTPPSTSPLDTENLCAARERDARRPAPARLRPAGGSTEAADDRGVVDDAVDDHRLGLRRDRDRVGRHLGDLPGQVFSAGKVLRAAVGSNEMGLHSWSSASSTSDVFCTLHTREICVNTLLMPSFTDGIRQSWRLRRCSSSPATKSSSRRRTSAASVPPSSRTEIRAPHPPPTARKRTPSAKGQVSVISNDAASPGRNDVVYARQLLREPDGGGITEGSQLPALGRSQRLVELPDAYGIGAR